MKKLCAIIVLFILFSSLCAYALASFYSVDELYPRIAVVYALDYDNDIVTVEDCVGNLWDFESCEDWKVGDIVSMIMFTNYTSSIYDDEIIRVTYGGSW